VYSIPSIDLHHRRSGVQIVRSTGRLYGYYPWLFLVLAVAVVAPWDLVRLAITGSGPFGQVRQSFWEQQSIRLIELLLISPLVSAMHVHAVVMIGDGRRARLGSVARSGLRVLPTVAVAAAVAGIATEIGIFALVIPGMLLAIRFSVVAQAAAVEQTSVRAAWKRSWQLTRRNGGHVLEVFLLVGVLFLAVGLGAKALTIGAGARPGEVAAGIVLNSIVVSASALSTALLYFDLVSRQTENAPAPIEPAPGYGPTP
jgi:hypothetical protein